MTPLGHGAVALVAGRARRLEPWALVLGGVLPDLDWLLFWAPGFNEWHRVATHNVVFVVLASAIAAVVVGRWRRLSLARAYAAVALGAALHVLVDACMDTNPTNGIGIAPWWPFADTMWSPFNVMAYEDNPDGWNDFTRAAPGVLRGILWELPFLALAAWWYRPRRAPTAGR